MGSGNGRLRAKGFLIPAPQHGDLGAVVTERQGISGGSSCGVSRNPRRETRLLSPGLTLLLPAGPACTPSAFTGPAPKAVGPFPE